MNGPQSQDNEPRRPAQQDVDEREPVELARDPNVEDDPIAGFTPLQRVAQVHPILTPIHRELPLPPVVTRPEGRAAVELRFSTFVPPTRRPVMATMSDLGNRGSATPTPLVAKVGPRPTVAPTADRTKTES